MKNVLLATVATLLTAGTASAADLGLFGSVEYAVESETTEVVAGVDTVVDTGIGGIGLAFAVTGNNAPVEYEYDCEYSQYYHSDMCSTGTSQDFEFAKASLTASYDVNENAAVYATVETDDEWVYAETTVGVALNF